MATTVREISIADAASEAYEELQTLAEEMRQWADSIEEKFSHTEKYERISEAADTLENIQEPDYCDYAKNMTIKITDLPKRKRGHPRAHRCTQACYILDVCIETLEYRIEDIKDDKSAETECNECSTLRDDLEQAKGEAEGVEFPGMYG
jgi:hypothetical protein